MEDSGFWFREIIFNAPALSVTFAVVTRRACGRPSVSTSIWSLIPETFLPPSYPFFSAVSTFFMLLASTMPSEGWSFFERVTAQHVYQFFLRPCQEGLCHPSPLTILGSSNTPIPIWENRKATSATVSHPLTHIGWRRKHHTGRFFWVSFSSLHFRDPVVWFQTVPDWCHLGNYDTWARLFSVFSLNYNKILEHWEDFKQALSSK